MIEHTTQRLFAQVVQETANAWAHLVGDQGIILTDLSGFGAAAFPEAPLGRLLQPWAVTQRHPFHHPPPAALLTSLATAGLVPRPGTGLRFSRQVVGQTTLLLCRHSPVSAASVDFTTLGGRRVLSRYTVEIGCFCNFHCFRMMQKNCVEV